MTCNDCGQEFYPVNRCRCRLLRIPIWLRRHVQYQIRKRSALRRPAE